MQSPLGDYNSALVLYAFLREMSVSEAKNLFSLDVYQHVKYLTFWQFSKSNLVKEGDEASFPLEDMIEKWSTGQSFMHSINHPKIYALADIARTLLQSIGFEITTLNPQNYVVDSLIDNAVWPIYPGIAEHYGLVGEYAFKVPKSKSRNKNGMEVLGLEDFIARSYECYANVPKHMLACERLNAEHFRDIPRAQKKPKAPAMTVFAPPVLEQRTPGENPYMGIPSYQHWRKAMTGVNPSDMDPVVIRDLSITKDDRVATAGSCFAQHIARTLQGAGYNYFVAERAPANMSAAEAWQANYGVFSARYGNIYSARQLVQLFDRAYGRFDSEDTAWMRPDGRYADPFRPRIEAGGYVSAEEVGEAARAHLAAVRHMFERLDVFVFTLGLTEGWRSKRDGAVFPLAPGVAAGEMDPEKYEFVNFTVAEVTADLRGFVERLRKVNPAAKIILTVSPVPLMATFENRHVLTATTYSKAVLRVAAEEISRSQEKVWYFPSYEIITGNYSRGMYYEDDLRSVTTQGVQHVMRLFLAHTTAEGVGGATGDAAVDAELRAVADIICDEEAIAASTSG